MENEYSTKKQFLLFLVVGGINTFNGILFAAIFSFLFSAQIAFVVGYLCSLIISYLLNTTFVFKQPVAWVRFIKFCISYIPNFLIQFVLVALMLEYLPVHKFIVYAIAAVIGVPITFIMVKFFALNKKKS